MQVEERSVIRQRKQDGPLSIATRLADLRDMLLAAAAVLLAYFIVSAGIAGALEPTRPEASARWWPGFADAGAAVAESRLRTGDAKDALASARWALGRNPLNVTAIRVAGLALDAQGASAPAERLVRFAGTRGWRDIPTELWLMRRNLAERRLDEAIENADAVLRESDEPALNAQVLSVLTTAANFTPAVRPLAQRLSLSPPWRGAFLAALGGSPQDRAGANAILTVLRMGPTPPTADEMSPYIDRLVSEGQYALALDRWRALAPGVPGAGQVIHDGDFAAPTDATAFTWSLAQGAGGAATAGRLPDDPGQGGLRVDYDGVSQPALPRQLLAPGPQAYRITGEAFAEVSAPNAGVRWIVECAGDQRRLAQSVLFGAAGGRQGFVIDVPAAQDCPFQWLGLEAVPGERPGEVVVWFDHLRFQAGSVRAASH